MLTALLSGIGFSSSAGLNAYLPLLILALADRFSSTVELDDPYNAISSTGGIIVLLVILPVELFADKIPTLDHYSNLLHTAIRPLAGAFCFMAVASQDDRLNVWVAAILGLAIGAAVALWKLRERPAVTIGSKGLGNPFVSVLEDGIAIVASLFAAFLPIVNVLLIPAAGAYLYRTYRRMQQGESRLVNAFQPRPRSQ